MACRDAFFAPPLEAGVSILDRCILLGSGMYEIAAILDCKLISFAGRIMWLRHTTVLWLPLLLQNIMLLVKTPSDGSLAYKDQVADRASVPVDRVTILRKSGRQKTAWATPPRL